MQRGNAPTAVTDTPAKVSVRIGQQEGHTAVSSDFDVVLDRPAVVAVFEDATTRNRAVVVPRETGEISQIDCRDDELLLAEHGSPGKALEMLLPEGLALAGRRVQIHATPGHTDDGSVRLDGSGRGSTVYNAPGGGVRHEHRQIDDAILPRTGQFLPVERQHPGGRIVDDPNLGNRAVRRNLGDGGPPLRHRLVEREIALARGVGARQRPDGQTATGGRLANREP